MPDLARLAEQIAVNERSTTAIEITSEQVMMDDAILANWIAKRRKTGRGPKDLTAAPWSAATSTLEWRHTGRRTRKSRYGAPCQRLPQALSVVSSGLMRSQHLIS